MMQSCCELLSMGFLSCNKLNFVFLILYVTCMNDN